MSERAAKVVPLARVVAADTFLARVYRDHRAELANFVRRKFGEGPPEPEDVVQAAFMKLAAFDAPETIANPRAFLYRTAKNIAIDARRRLARRAAWAEGEGRVEAAEHEESVFTPERVVIGRQEFAVLENAVRALPAKHRRFLLMNRVDGLTFAEIARREKVSASGVAKIVAQALERCQKTLNAAQRAPLRAPSLRPGRRP